MKARPSIRQLERLQDPSVVVLPTAAPRQVKQPHTAAWRAARAKLHDTCQFPRDQYRDPGLRRAMDMAKAMDEMDRSPELYLLLVMLELIPREQRQVMADTLSRAPAGGTPHRAGLIVRSTLLSVGEQIDLRRAQAELSGGRA